MYTNVGAQIKSLATTICWITRVLFILGGLVFAVAAESPEYFLVAAVMAVLGWFMGWLSGLFIYGFGQLIENSDKLVSLKEAERTGV